MSATLTLSLGWWLLPLAITIAGPIWALPRRSDEQPNGGMFSDMGYTFGVAFRLLIAAIVALIAWLIWSLAR